MNSDHRKIKNLRLKIPVNLLHIVADINDGSNISARTYCILDGIWMASLHTTTIQHLQSSKGLTHCYRIAITAWKLLNCFIIMHTAILVVVIC